MATVSKPRGWVCVIRSAREAERHGARPRPRPTAGPAAEGPAPGPWRRRSHEMLPGRRTPHSVRGALPGRPPASSAGALPSGLWGPANPVCVPRPWPAPRFPPPGRAKMPCLGTCREDRQGAGPPSVCGRLAPHRPMGQHAPSRLRLTTRSCHASKHGRDPRGPPPCFSPRHAEQRHRRDPR